jgi:release factor glutamine methyltransferase
LLAHLDEPVAPSARLRVDALVERRRSGEPLQWVLGMWGFRGVDVAVDGRALVPRPETEIVVDAALAQLALAQPALAQLALAQLALAQLGRADQPCRVADLGTGSGVIALSIAAEVPAVEVFATDASGLALSLAAENLARQEAGVRSRVRLLRGDWFGALPIELAGSLAVVVSNPPYLAADEWPELDAVVRDYDPYESLVAGATGLEVISLLIAEAPRWLRAGGSLVVEIAPHQSEAVLRLIGAMGGYASAQVLNDLAGRPRVLVASLPA